MRSRAVLKTVASTLILGGAAAYLILAPPRAAPAYEGARPEPAPVGDGYISHTESIVVDVGVVDYDAWASRAPLESILPSGNGVPRVVRTEMIQGTWNQPGARRRVVLADGHYAVEEVLARDKPERFRYEVWGYTNVARLAVDYALGEFLIEDQQGKTRITWTYAFHNCSPLTTGLLRRFVDDTWAPYMRSVLGVMKAEAERSASD